MTHKSCYGTMFPPDLIRPKMNRRVSGKVFAYENRLPGGSGDAHRDTFVNRDEASIRPWRLAACRRTKMWRRSRRAAGRPKVGPTGMAIGIDMSQEMIDLARRNAANGIGGRPLENVELYPSTIDKLPLGPHHQSVRAAVRVITDWVEQHSDWQELVMVVTGDHGHYLVLDRPERLVKKPAPATE